MDETPYKKTGSKVNVPSSELWPKTRKIRNFRRNLIKFRFDYKKLLMVVLISSTILPITGNNEVKAKEMLDPKLVDPKRQVQAYDCNNPSDIQVFALQSEDKCKENNQDMEDFKETKVDVYQENKLVEVEGYSCEVWRDRSVHQCGSFSHSSVYPEKWWNRKIFPVEPGECKIWMKTGQYIVSSFEVCPECQNFSALQSFR